MNIGEALETVRRLKKAIEEVDRALTAAERTECGEPVQVSARVFVMRVGDVAVNLDRETCVQALRDTKAGYEARITKLQPVIDMANAALKGVLS